MSYICTVSLLFQYYFQHCHSYCYGYRRTNFFLIIASTTPYANCTDGELRLVGGADATEGRVEICINRAWGSICDQGFTKEEATVVCRQLLHLQSEGVSVRY